MPTLLQLADIAVPDTVVGRFMLGNERRDYLYGEMGVERRATRMLHDGRYKLIYYRREIAFNYLIWRMIRRN